MREPDNTDMRLPARSIDYEWKVGERTNRYDEPCEVWAVLLCSHRKAGVNYLAGERHPSQMFASLRQEERTADGMRSHMLFTSLGILTEEVARYSKAKLQEFAPRALERLGEVEDHPKVAPFFAVGEWSTSSGIAG